MLKTVGQKHEPDRVSKTPFGWLHERTQSGAFTLPPKARHSPVDGVGKPSFYIYACARWCQIFLSKRWLVDRAHKFCVALGSRGSPLWTCLSARCVVVYKWYLIKYFIYLGCVYYPALDWFLRDGKFNAVFFYIRQYFNLRVWYVWGPSACHSQCWIWRFV